MLLLKTIGATQLAFAASFCWRAIKHNDHNSGWSMFQFHCFQLALLSYCYLTGGMTHKLLLPFMAHNAVAAGGLLYFTENPAQKFLRQLRSGHAPAA